MKKQRQRSWGLAKEAERIVRYWRDSLVDAQRSEVRESRKYGVDVPMPDIARGRCSPTLFPSMVKALESSKRGGGRIDDEGPLAVLLCPLLLHRQSEAYSGPRVLESFWVPAQLDRSGRLFPPVRGEPWIPRSLLEPMLDDEHPAIGSIDTLNEFALTHSKQQQWREWESYWAYAELMFASVTDLPLASFECEGFSVRRNGLMMPDNVGSSGMFSLQELYDRVLAGRQPPGLLPEVARRSSPPAKAFIERKRWITQMANRHCGQFGDAFPLALSQRRAVHRALDLREGEFLCVTGPPGTGKTTMLQSIIASMFVQAVRDERSYPPVIAATGATNQAVTNVITAMEKASDDSSLLASRWIPGVDSYGTFCVSATRAQDLERVEGFQLEQMNGEGLSRALEQPEALREAERIYLQNFKAFSGKQLTLRQAVRHLAKLIARERGVLYRNVLVMRDGTFTDWLAALFGMKPKKPTEQFFAELAHFDQQLRYKLFLLAARFWEGRWLLEMQDRRLEGGRREGGARGRLATSTLDWKRRAMLTPTFVSTPSMLPRFFPCEREATVPPIDLLIFDEASQVSPELGAGCLALAARALVVGDDRWPLRPPVAPAPGDLSGFAGTGL